MKSFDEWWETQNLSKVDVPKALMLAFKEVSQRAWEASSNCPVCQCPAGKFCEYYDADNSICLYEKD